MKLSTRLTAMAILSLSSLYSNAALSQSREAVLNGPAISGYSPVSYFTKGIPERGKQDFAVEHKGDVYFLASEEQVAIFKQDPDKYRPRHKVCSYSLALGMIKPLDPTNFKIIGDMLLMFHVSDESDSQKLWDDSPLSEQELLQKADANLFLVTF